VRKAFCFDIKYVLQAKALAGSLREHTASLHAFARDIDARQLGEAQYD
jgi:hypothetical protein